MAKGGEVLTRLGIDGRQFLNVTEAGSTLGTEEFRGKARELGETIKSQCGESVTKERCVEIEAVKTAADALKASGEFQALLAGRTGAPGAVAAEGTGAEIARDLLGGTGEGRTSEGLVSGGATAAGGNVREAIARMAGEVIKAEGSGAKVSAVNGAIESLGEGAGDKVLSALDGARIVLSGEKTLFNVSEIVKYLQKGLVDAKKTGEVCERTAGRLEWLVWALEKAKERAEGEPQEKINTLINSFRTAITAFKDASTARREDIPTRIKEAINALKTAVGDDLDIEADINRVEALLKAQIAMEDVVTDIKKIAEDDHFDFTSGSLLAGLDTAVTMFTKAAATVADAAVGATLQLLPELIRQVKEAKTEEEKKDKFALVASALEKGASAAGKIAREKYLAEGALRALKTKSDGVFINASDETTSGVRTALESAVNEEDNIAALFKKIAGELKYAAGLEETSKVLEEAADKAEDFGTELLLRAGLGVVGPDNYNVVNSATDALAMLSLSLAADLGGKHVHDSGIFEAFVRVAYRLKVDTIDDVPEGFTTGPVGGAMQGLTIQGMLAYLFEVCDWLRIGPEVGGGVDIVTKYRGHHSLSDIPPWVMPIFSAGLTIKLWERAHLSLSWSPALDSTVRKFQIEQPTLGNLGIRVTWDF